MDVDRRTFAIIGGTTAIAAAVEQAKAKVLLTGRRIEAPALIRFAEETHPRGLEAKEDARWRLLRNRFLASVDAPPAEYIVRAYALLAWFKDGHTTLWARDLKVGPFALDMPIRVGAFYDGLYVIEATQEHRDLLGRRIAAVGRMPIAEVIRRFADIWPANNPAWPHHDAGLLFETPGLLHGLGVITGPDVAPLTVTVSATGGRDLSRKLLPASKFERSKLQRTHSLRENWASAAGSGNFLQRLPDERTLYVSLEDISQPVDQFLTFTRQIFAAMDEPQWSKLILDLRRNPGGNNFLGEPLRKHIERSRFNRPGSLYVLISPVTFSAAQNLANRLERETFGIFAGEPTGGAPNHHGDAKKFEPASILQGGVSTLPWFDSYPMDKRQWIMPDLLIPRTYDDWASGRDKVLDAVLAHHTDSGDNDASEDRVFYYSRKSQSQQWKPFWLG